MDSRPIGIFDSGVGGLTVVKQVVKALPNEDIIYFGDTARVPYGSKSKETVTKFSSQIIRFLLSKKVKSVVIACNTVSSNCFEELTNQFSLPIIEVVSSGVESCVEQSKNKIVGVIGTEATVKSGAYEKKIIDYDSDFKVFSKACPLFVPIAEEGWADTEVARLTAEIYLKPLVRKGIDSIILGCTHYPILKKCIGGVVGENIKIIDPAYATAIKTRDYLEKNNMLSQSGGNITFFVSDETEKFDFICESVLGKNCIAEKINIEIY